MRVTTVIVLTLTLCILNSGCNSESSRDAYFYNNRGVDYDGQGEWDKAIADYDMAIELEPQLAVAYSNRGAVYQQQGELDKAILDFTKAIFLEPADAHAYSNRGFVFEELGDNKNAEADFAKAKELGYEPE